MTTKGTLAACAAALLLSACSTGSPESPAMTQNELYLKEQVSDLKDALTTLTADNERMKKQLASLETQKRYANPMTDFDLHGSALVARDAYQTCVNAIILKSFQLRFTTVEATVPSEHTISTIAKQDCKEQRTSFRNEVMATDKLEKVKQQIIRTSTYDEPEYIQIEMSRLRQEREVHRTLGKLKYSKG